MHPSGRSPPSLTVRHGTSTPRGCLAINWAPVDHDDLLRGVGHVQYEWTQMAGCAARLELVDGIRTPDENATLEALFVHARCLINFLCGNYRGGWMQEDMKPADFLRAPWVLPDDEMDRRLRGRLTVINRSLAHLCWRRVTNDRGVMAVRAPRSRGALGDAPVRGGLARE